MGRRLTDQEVLEWCVKAHELTQKYGVFSTGQLNMHRCYVNLVFSAREKGFLETTSKGEHRWLPEEANALHAKAVHAHYQKRRKAWSAKTKSKQAVAAHVARPGRKPAKKGESRLGAIESQLAEIMQRKDSKDLEKRLVAVELAIQGILTELSL